MLRDSRWTINLYRESGVPMQDRDHRRFLDSQQGDIYWPIQNGVITWEKVIEISDVLSGKVKGRTDDKQIIVYKNQGGQGIIDIALAKKCYELAKAQHKGSELRIEPRLNWWVQGGRAETW